MEKPLMRGCEKRGCVTGVACDASSHQLFPPQWYNSKNAKGRRGALGFIHRHTGGRRHAGRPILRKVSAGFASLGRPQGNPHEKN